MDGGGLGLPLRDYALIGDCHGAALVGKNGALDWCCFGRFDADPCFWRLLDEGGPSFVIAPEGTPRGVRRQYRAGTNVLETYFETETGTLVLTDVMPVWPGGADEDPLYAPLAVLRRVEARGGRQRVRLQRICPSTSFRGEVPVGAEAAIVCQEPLPVGSFVQSFSLEPGEHRDFVIAPEATTAHSLLKTVDDALGRTEAFWNGWRSQGRYHGPYTEAVYRSALTLKLLTFAPTGALVAAPTTSLPEVTGGTRNWDYRYGWIRDAAFTLHALAVLGYDSEARAFSGFLRLCCVGTDPRMQIMYGVGGETELPEIDLGHLSGYAHSRPVRVGNAAHRQQQADVFGELLDWAHLYHALGEPIDAVLRQRVEEAAETVCRTWMNPDSGLWEARTPPRHYVYSKLMMWVALDRAMDLLGTRPAWEQARADLLAEVRAHGIAPAGHLVQAYGSDELDAALLLTPFLGVPLDRSVVDATLTAVETRLRQGDYVRRYLSDDGLPGSEGAFLMCSFWLVDALLVQDRGDDARALFERLLCRANDVGLYAEEMDPEDYTFLGNFPQAFTHLALINAAVNLELYAAGGAEALSGTHADRAAQSFSSKPPPHLQ